MKTTYGSVLKGVCGASLLVCQRGEKLCRVHACTRGGGSQRFSARQAVKGTPNTHTHTRTTNSHAS